MKSSKRELDGPRGRDWLWSALWAAAGERRAPRCNTYIPLTFLFQSGLPYKVLATEDESRHVIQVPFEELVKMVLRKARIQQ